MTTSYTVANSVPMSALPTTNGIRQQFLAVTTNPSNATFAPDALAAAPIFGLGGQALQGGEIASGGIATLVSYIGPLLNSGSLCWVLLNCDGGAQQVGSGAGSQQAATVGQVQEGALYTAVAAGTADALTATVASTLTSLSNGQPFIVLAAAANTAAATLTLTLGSTALSALPIVKGNNQALAIGDIPAAGYPIELNYSSTFNALVMQNPASGVVAASGIVGSMSNAKMYISAAAVSGTFTADQIIVATALNGLQYLLPTYSQTINLGTTGAGGMDTGAAPASGYVALYAIYNPATKATSIVATNATLSVAPTIYSGANMPSGYTASALIGVWPTTASSQFNPGFQRDRTLFFTAKILLTTGTVVPVPVSLPIASAVPPNAVFVSGFLIADALSAGTVYEINVGGDANLIGEQAVATEGIIDGVKPVFPFNNVPIITTQTIYYGFANDVGSCTITIEALSYSI